MNLIKLICLTLAGLAKQAWLFPQSVSIDLRQRRQRITLNGFEVERLDRLRHPSKYVGR